MRDLSWLRQIDGGRLRQKKRSYKWRSYVVLAEKEGFEPSRRSRALLP